MADQAKPGVAGSQAPGQPQEGGVFLRKASGLVRDVKAKDVLFFNMGGVNAGLGLAWVGAFALAFYPGVSPGLAVFIPLVFCVIVTLCYLFFNIMMPRSGGEYLIISRAIHPSVGMALSFTYWVMIIYFQAFGVYYVSTLALGPFFEGMAIRYHSERLLAFSTNFYKDWVTFLIGAGLLLVFGLVCSRRVKLVLRVQLVFWVFAFSCLIAMAVALIFTSPADFAGRIDEWGRTLGNDFTYQSVIAGGKAAGFSLAPFSIVATLQASIWATWALAFGAQTASFAGEIRKVGRSVMVGSVGAVAISGLLMLLVTLLAKHAMGAEFLGAITTAPVGDVYPWPHLLTAIGTGNPVLAILILIGFIAWPIMFLFVCFFYVTRTAFAWSFDLVAPSWFGKVSEKYHTPTNSITFSFVAALVFLAALCFTEFFGKISGIVPMLVAIGTVGVSAMVFPYRRRDLFERSPVNYRVLGVPVMAILGFLSAVFIYGSAVMMVRDPLTGTTAGSSVYFVVGMILFGFFYFWVIKWYRMSKDGVDIMLNYDQIPSE